MAKKIVQSVSTLPEGSLKAKPGNKDLPSGSKPLGTNNPSAQPVPKSPQATNVKPFGLESSEIDRYPNDVVVLDIYNAVGVYLESSFRVSTFTKSGNDITLDVEADVKNLGYVSGKYNAEYKFHRNILGSGDGHKVEIQEISSDGLEARIVPTPSATLNNANFLEFFSNGLFKLPKAQVLPNLVLLRQTATGTQSYRIFDYVQDKFTISLNPYSIVLKFASPLPANVALGENVWIAQQVSDPIIDTITVVPPKPRRNQTIIAGANWDVLNKTQTTVTTPYKDWDDILSTNTPTAEAIINSLLSGSLIEGVNLNTDFRKFENYVTLGSAAERLENFRYKMTLLESYNARIAELTTNLIGSPSSSVTGSATYQTNVINAQTKRAALLGTFDSYEKYLYNQSSSYESSSYGEFYPTAWPKSNSTYPYVNYSVTSSQVEDWWDGIYSSASLYDQNNDQALYRLIPAHVLEDAANDEYTLLVNMMGHYFDTMMLYIKHITKTYDRNQSTYEGFSRDLIYNVAKNLGVDFENGNTLEDLWSYALGTTVSGSNVSTYGSEYPASNKDRTKEIWKRIINNLPYLLKTKGTERGVRALINCFGIPQTILRIREYGGPEADFDSKTDLQYERFFYALPVGYDNVNADFRRVDSPWAPLAQNNLMPMTVELRAKFAEGVAGTYMTSSTLLDTVSTLNAGQGWQIRAFSSGSGTHLGFFLTGNTPATASFSCSIFDGDFYHIALTRGSATDDYTQSQTYTLSARKTNYQKVVATYSASVTVVDPNTNKWFVYPQSTVDNVPGILTTKRINSNSDKFTWTGSIQELRYWSEPLQNAILDNHALAPTSFQGNLADTYTGSTSSFYTLGYRLCLGSDNKKQGLFNTPAIQSQHPNQTKNYFSGSILAEATAHGYFTDDNIFEPLVETHSLEWPDLGGNRSVSNKVRIEDTFTAGGGVGTEGNILYRNNSVQRSLADNQPPDSPRLGIYLSPQNEVNQDIAEQFGGISIDDYIGDPSYLSLDTYPGLDALKREYSKKFTSGRNKPQNYIRLLQYYDASLFQLIKKFVPHRANTQVGLVIEPTIIERAKVRLAPPSYEELHYSTSIDVGPDAIWTPGGAVQDGDGEPERDQPYWANNGYVAEGKIGGDESDYITLSGEEHRVAEYNDIVNYPEYDYQAPRLGIDVIIPEPDQEEVDYIVIDGTNPSLVPSFDDSYANEFTRLGIDDNPSTSGSMAGPIDLGISSYGRDTRVEGSQYRFITWARSGSGSTISNPYLVDSLPYDYYQAVVPAIITAKYSERSNNEDGVYGKDVLAGKAFTGSRALETGSTIFTASYAFQSNLWTSQYGLHISNSFTGSTSVYGSSIYGTAVYGGGAIALPGTGTYHWRMDNTDGLYFYNGATGAGATRTNFSGSVSIDAFFYDQNQPQTYNYLYETKITVATSGTVTADLILFFGGFNSTIQATITVTPTPTTYTYTTLASGTELGILAAVATATPGGEVQIRSLSIKSLNYRAEVQDFHLHDSYGMRNARYDGCKLTSTDYNIDSPDTVDGGPVITITEGTGVELVSKPTARGNFEIR